MIHTCASSAMQGLLIVLICLGQLGAISFTVEAQAPDFPDGARIVGDDFTKDADKFSFAIIGDKTGGGQDKWPIFDRAMDEVNELDPDFAIMVGDLIQGYTENLDVLEQEWAEFWKHQSRLQIPFLPLPGNHDISNPVMYDYWVKKIGLTHYAFVYKGCLFILLNTEEKHSGQDGWFGKTQINHVIGELEKHKHVRHTFVFMHQPLWLYSDSDWGDIEAALSGRAYTVFAGHFHNLTLHTRNDHRYFVLGATGGGFTPRQMKEYGAFDHYSIVTVDKDEVTVALIEPGNIYPANLSTAEFKDKFRNMLTYEAEFKFDRSQPLSTGEITFNLKNTLENVAKVEIAFDQRGHHWQFSPEEIRLEIQPGWEVSVPVELSCGSNQLTPFPRGYRYAIIYGGERLYGSNDALHPINPEHLHYIKHWRIVGPFDLGVDRNPAGGTNVPKANHGNFQAPLGHEQDWSASKKYQGKNGEVTWQEHHAEGEVVDLNKVYNAEGVIAYGLAYIKSPEKRTVLVGIRNDEGARLFDDITRIFVNGVEIHTEWSMPDHLTYIDLPLNKGWNTVMVKSANYEGSWTYGLAVENPNNDLVFSHTK